MIFNSITFLLFFPLVVLLYYFIPTKIRYIYLLLVSYFFYACFVPKALVILVAITVASYGLGLLINKAPRAIIIISALFHVGILASFKFVDWTQRDILVPLGVSYFLLQSLSYTIDIYKGKIEAEKNILVYALYIAFFPKIISGPIESTNGLLEQIRLRKNISCKYTNIVNGCITMLWGYFMKLVIADRAAVYVNNVFEAVDKYGSVELSLAAILFGVQLYADFAGYSSIASGLAMMLGYNLIDNFSAPYFAMSVSEFWHRWHISLSSWLKEYVYIPLGGNKKGRWRRDTNILITFIVSGLWHGTGLQFVLWGFLHGLAQVVEKELGNIRQNNISNEAKESFGYKFFKTLITFVIVDIAWIVFRAASISEACHFIYRMLSVHDWWVINDSSLYLLGLSIVQFRIMVIGITVLFFVDYIQYKENISLAEWLQRQWTPFKYLAVISMIYMCVIYGYYGVNFNSGNFFYAAF